MTDEPMMSLGDIAKFLNCSKRTLERMREQGELPPPDLCRRKLLRWYRSTILEWVESTSN